jgi:predicted  nucleic acid-binding Zn-ribbon protein
VLLEFKCVKCGEIWAVETAPPNPEPVSCCPRCAGFIRRFLRSEQVCQAGEGIRPRAAALPESDAGVAHRLRLRTRPQPPLNRLH